MTRLEVFIDAAFAFAVTMLVISFDAIPRSYDEMMLAIKAIPAFVLAVAQLVWIWHTLALLVRARNLVGDTTGADTMAESAEQLVQRMRDQGWQGPQLDYTLASLAAAQGLVEQALAHLRDGIEAGWDDFGMTNHDPLMADIIHLPEYLELSD